MSVTQKILDDIYTEILISNKNLSPAAIPHSDTFMKHILSALGISPETAKSALKLLADAHKIFTMEIIAEDPNRNIDRVEGYIAADFAIVTMLKNYFGDLLCRQYEQQFNKHLMVHQVIKEMFPIIKSMNSTELGQITNKTIMLVEFERLLERSGGEFTEEWQEKELVKIAQHEGFSYQPKAHVKVSPFVVGVTPVATVKTVRSTGSFSRAVDSDTFKDFSEKKGKYPLQRILNIYGIDFFIKVYLRKYQFTYLKQIIEDRQISRREDLLLIKQLVEKVKANVHSESELNAHRNEIYTLESAVIHALYFTPPPKKKPQKS
jgi:hypothetical protein